ncbi:beta-galactosidase [Bifidobacterium pullorum]|nr:beta-galactosidase [Bifidobacterium pullorum]
MIGQTAHARPHEYDTLSRMRYTGNTKNYNVVSNQGGLMFPRQHSSHIMFGTAYYLEYGQPSQLDEDMQLMKDAHINVIRVGESVWSRWEPREGLFNLDWLAPILNAAYIHGIDVIIGLPTYAIPMWMARQYPDIALQSSRGARRGFGAREEHNYSHPTFRFFAERICRKIMERYRDHPAVIGWQLHNEPGIYNNTSPSAFEGFKDWLRTRYSTVDDLNREWGLVYWSHELSTWDDLWEPESNAQPQYDIEWRRYQAELTEILLTWQRDLVAELRRDEQFITLNHAMGRYATNESSASRLLDVAGSDPYYQMQDGLASPQATTCGTSWAPAGAFVPALLGDRSFSLKQAPYFVLETNGGPIDGSNVNLPGYDGQWRQVGWQFVSRGAELIEYWQWRQLRFGTELYWGGILSHDGQPGRVYREIAELGKELEQAGDAVTHLVPDHDVTMLYSVESRWALAYEPHLPSPDGAVKYDNAYDDTFNVFYQGAFLAGRQVNIVQDDQLVNPANGEHLIDAEQFAKSNPVLVAVGTYLCSDQLLDWLRQYVAAGGHLMLGPRSGYADRLTRARENIKPAMLDDLAKASYQEFSNLSTPIAVTSTIPEIDFGSDAMATSWIDCLETHGAQVLASCDHPHFRQFPLVTSTASGKGRVTIIGTLPNAPFAKALFKQLTAGTEWSEIVQNSRTISHSSAVNGSGQRIHWFFNWSWDTVSLTLPKPLRTLGNYSDPAKQITHIRLDAWDVVMLLE